jgi:L-alanine-DL-glutamate epimerase-like enolase superfamily enzyme
MTHKETPMAAYQTLADSERNRVRITGIKAFQLKGHGIQSLIRVDTDAGIHGVGEAGLPAVIVQGYLEFMKDSLIGQDALAIEKCYADMTRMRAQWHAHWTQNPTVSGIDMALWDIAGKVFNRSVSELLTGRFRDGIGSTRPRAATGRRRSRRTPTASGSSSSASSGCSGAGSPPMPPTRVTCRRCSRRPSST